MAERLTKSLAKIQEYISRLTWRNSLIIGGSLATAVAVTLRSSSRANENGYIHSPNTGFDYKLDDDWCLKATDPETFEGAREALGDNTWVKSDTPKIKITYKDSKGNTLSETTLSATEPLPPFEGDIAIFCAVK